MHEERHLSQNNKVGKEIGRSYIGDAYLRSEIVTSSHAAHLGMRSPGGTLTCRRACVDHSVGDLALRHRRQRAAPELRACARLREDVSHVVRGVDPT